MLKTEFEKIAIEEGASLTIQDEKIDFGGGVRSPNLIFSLTLEYRGRTINISNSTGTYFVGRIDCIISNSKESFEFEMTTRSHFSNLFSRKKDQFKLVSQNINVEVFLGNSVGLSKLKTIAKNTLFEPTIFGQNVGNTFQLITEYHLQFSDWPQVIQPLILFYKEFIDRFRRDN